MKDSKKKAAVLAAVANYIKTQEEAAAAVQPQVDVFHDQAQAAPPACPQVPLYLWGLSGRQQQMQLRTMMQLKVFQPSRRI